MSHLAKSPSWIPNIVGIMDVNTPAIWEELPTEVEQRRIHFTFPLSMDLENPTGRFYLLKSKWEKDTAFLSSMANIAMHPAYQQIIGMGSIAIPLILSELKQKPGHWFWALNAITGEDPVPPEQRGKIKEMAKVWIEWGTKRGYIK